MSGCVSVPESLEIEFIDVYSPSGDGPINQWISVIMNDEEVLRLYSKVEK